MISYCRRPKTGLFFSYATVLSVLLFLVSTVAISQTKPAAAKQGAAKPAAKSAAAKSAAAKPAAAKAGTAKKSSAAAAKKTSAKPATAAPAARTSGQAVTTRPVTGQSASPGNRSEAAPSSGTPNKTATEPTSDYKAKSNTAATHHQPVRKTKSYTYGFYKENKLLNVGLGLSSYYYGTPIGVSFEAGVHPDISVGGQLDYNSGRYNDYYYNSSRWGYKAYYIGVRGSYHFNRLLRINTSKVDVYAGVGIGYQSFRWNDSSYGYGYDYNSGLFPNYFAGGKFYFTPKVGAFVELGYTGLSSSRVGVSFKF